MAKTSKTAAKSAAKTVRRAPRAAAAVQQAAPVSAPPAATSLYPVLAPFKFAGVVVKPPEWIELNADEAREYQEAGVLGTKEAELPDKNSEGAVGGTGDATASGE